MDETYPIYLNRVARMTLPDTYRTQVQFIQESPKYIWDAEGQRRAKPFPGYTICTPPWKDLKDEPVTLALYQELERCQKQLLDQLGSDLFIPVPSESFHLTLADLVWESAYQDAIAAHPDFEAKLQHDIARIFQGTSEELENKGSIPLQMLGLTLMPRAIVVCLAPTDVNAHNRLWQFRRLIYQSPELMGLGIEQQYGFTAHITLGYFGTVAEDFDPEQVCEILSRLNDAWLGTRNLFDVHYAQLRKFEDMTDYHREANWPVFAF